VYRNRSDLQTAATSLPPSYTGSVWAGGFLRSHALLESGIAKKETGKRRKQPCESCVRRITYSLLTNYQISGILLQKNSSESILKFNFQAIGWIAALNSFAPASSECSWWQQQKCIANTPNKDLIGRV